MKIKTIEFCASIFIMMQCCLMGFFFSGTYKYMGANGWIIPIIGTFIGFPILLLYLYIFNKKEDINKIINNYFGKFGKFINILLILFISFFASILFWNVTEFTHLQYLYNTPLSFISIILILCIIYILNNGTNSLFRTLLMIGYILLMLHIINSISLVSQVNLNNIKPLFYGKFNILKPLLDYIVYTICPIFCLLIIPKNKIEDKNLNKNIIITYFISCLTTTIILFLIISVCGINIIDLFQYPEFHILKRVSFLGISQRLEKILAIYWFLVGISGVILFSHYVFHSLKTNFNTNKINYLYIIIILFCSQYFFPNIIVARNFINYIFTYLIPIFLIIIPLILCIKIKKSSKTT